MGTLVGYQLLAGKLGERIYSVKDGVQYARPVWGGKAAPVVHDPATIKMLHEGAELAMATNIADNLMDCVCQGLPSSYDDTAHERLSKTVLKVVRNHKAPLGERVFRISKAVAVLGKFEFYEGKDLHDTLNAGYTIRIGSSGRLAVLHIPAFLPAEMCVPDEATHLRVVFNTFVFSDVLPLTATEPIRCAFPEFHGRYVSNQSKYISVHLDRPKQLTLTSKMDTPLAPDGSPEPIPKGCVVIACIGLAFFRQDGAEMQPLPDADVVAIVTHHA